MRRVVTTLGLAALMMVLFTGCITQQFEINFNEDGSGTLTLRVGISKQFAGMMKAMAQQQGNGEGPQGPFDELKGSLDEFPESWNARAKDWSNDKFEGVEISLDFKNAAELKAQLKRLMEAGNEDEPAPGPGGGPEAPELVRDWKIEQKDGKVTIGVTMDTSGPAGQAESNPQAGAFLADAAVSLKVTFAGGIESSNCDDIADKSEDGKSVSYNVPLTSGKKYDVEVVGKVAGDGGSSDDGGAESTPDGSEGGTDDGNGTGEGDDEDF